jgi:hypothetical protein
MSENSTYIRFDVFDYKNEKVLSSYSLEETPLKFVARLDNEKKSKILWSFGDGTYSESLEPSKFYKYPGTYYVNLVVYDCFTYARIAIQTAEIIIYDYLPLNFSIDTKNETSQILISSGKIHGPWSVFATYPVYQNKIDIFYEVEGSESEHHQSQKNNKYGHLVNTCGLYEKFYNNSIKSYQFREIDKLQVSNNSIYIKILNNDIIRCSKNDKGSIYVGMSGSKDFYFKDDTPSNQDIIKFYFDKTNLYNPISTNHVSYFNTTSVLLSCKVLPNTLSANYTITSNGLDGEYYQISSFNINPIQFEDQKLQFTIKQKDNESFSIKTTSISSVSAYLSINVNYLQPDEINTYLQPDGINKYVYITNFYTKFYKLCDYLGASTYYLNTSDLYINKNEINGPYRITIDNNGSPTWYSNEFFVYPKNYYKMSKKNEDFDMGSVFKDLRFQDVLIDKSVLFDDFLGTIYNNTDPIDDNIGSKIYEKISNFVENTQDIDRNEIDGVISQFKMLGGDISIDSDKFPESIKRILNLISISKNKLIGFQNKFSNNFDLKNRSSNDVYGKNLGNQINTNTYTVTAGKNIVALEKFSNNYSKLNTHIPLCASNISIVNNTYKLSSYNDTWGWPLVLPSNFDTENFDKYYDFFEYIETYDNTILDNTLIFNTPETTISKNESYTNLYKKNGIFDQMIREKLITQLNLSA